MEPRAGPDGWSPSDDAPPANERPAMDRWARSRPDATVEHVTARLADYDPTAAGRALEDLVDLGGLPQARTAGKLRQEGKDYLVQDGDVLLFKFNV